MPDKPTKKKESILTVGEPSDLSDLSGLRQGGELSAALSESSKLWSINSGKLDELEAEFSAPDESNQF